MVVLFSDASWYCIFLKRSLYSIDLLSDSAISVSIWHRHRTRFHGVPAPAGFWLFNVSLRTADGSISSGSAWRGSGSDGIGRSVRLHGNESKAEPASLPAVCFRLAEATSSRSSKRDVDSSLNLHPFLIWILLPSDRDLRAMHHWLFRRFERGERLIDGILHLLIGKERELIMFEWQTVHRYSHARSPRFSARRTLKVLIPFYLHDLIFGKSIDTANTRFQKVSMVFCLCRSLAAIWAARSCIFRRSYSCSSLLICSDGRTGTKWEPIWEEPDNAFRWKDSPNTFQFFFFTSICQKPWMATVFILFVGF